MLEKMLEIDYLEPTLVSKLASYLLSEEELNFLDNYIPPIISCHDEEHEKYNALKKELEDGIREICLNSQFYLYGWKENKERDPVKIWQSEDLQLLLNRVEFKYLNMLELFGPRDYVPKTGCDLVIINKSMIINNDGTCYHNCLVFKDDYDDNGSESYRLISYHEGILLWNKIPLFFWHENPLPEWYSGKPAANSDPEKNITTLSQREIRKNKTSDRNKELFQIYSKTKTENPTKSDKWISAHMAKNSPVKNWELTLETIRRIISKMKSGSVK